MPPRTQFEAPAPGGGAFADAPLEARLAEVRARLARLFAPSGEAAAPAPEPGPAVQRWRAGPDGRLRPLSPAPPAAALRRRPRGAPPSAAGEVIYAVGDVHGCWPLLHDLLAAVACDAAWYAKDRAPLLVFAGDYVDRGPASAEALEALVWLRRHGPWPLVLLKGNHEQAMAGFIEAPEGGGAWLRFGGAATLASYGVAPPAADPPAPADLVRARDALLSAMPAAHLHLLTHLDAMAVVGDYAFVHAGVAPGEPLARQHERDLLWIRGEFLEAARFEKVIVHGHTWTHDRPALLPHRIGLDTGAYETGVLSCVRLDERLQVTIQARDPHSAWRPPAQAAGAAAAAQAPPLAPRPPDYLAAQVGAAPVLAASPRVAPALARPAPAGRQPPYPPARFSA